ncbi:hypothetical protein MTO96_034672 [Rhipicephalus appendiculatus]
MSNVLAIGDMLSKNLGIPNTPWSKIMEGTCDDYAAEHRRRLLPVFQGELLLLEDVGETSQGSTWLVLYSACGGLNQTALVANSVGPPDLHRLEMTMQSVSEASFSGTSPGRRVRCGAFTSTEPRSLVLHVAQPPARHAALPGEAERRHAVQQQQHGRHGVSKILPKVTTRQREFRHTSCFPPSDGPTMLLRNSLQRRQLPLRVDIRASSNAASVGHLDPARPSKATLHFGGHRVVELRAASRAPFRSSPPRHSTPLRPRNSLEIADLSEDLSLLYS